MNAVRLEGGEILTSVVILHLQHLANSIAWHCMALHGCLRLFQVVLQHPLPALVDGVVVELAPGQRERGLAKDAK